MIYRVIRSVYSVSCSFLSASLFFFRFSSSTTAGEVMSLLLKEIQKIDERAAAVLLLSDLQTDSDIKLLTREELLQLFPAVTDIKRRRAIYNVIHKQVGLERDLNEDEKMEVQALQIPEGKKCRKLTIDHKQEVERVLNELKELIPSESFRAALTDNGVLVDYLRILKDMKTQMDNVQGFLEAHISLLEEFSKNHPDQESANCVPDDCPGEARGSGPADAGGKTKQKTGNTGHRPQPKKSSSVTGGKSDGRAPATLYKMVVSGKTFDTHLKLMETVEKPFQNQLQPCEGNGDNQITFVFCPISSRIASDVEAAMSNVKDHKPVILVLMHHAREVRPTTSVRTWNDDARVMLHVNVFYHETVGLLKCERNDAAVTEIQTTLMERFIQGVDADHGGTDQKDVGYLMRIYKKYS